MTSSNPIPPISAALVPYDPTLPHVSLKAHLEAAIEKRLADLAPKSAENASVSSLWRDRPASWQLKNFHAKAHPSSHLLGYQLPSAF